MTKNAERSADAKWVLRELKRLGAIIPGHVVGVEDHYNGTYIEKRWLLARPDTTDEIARRIASRFVTDGVEVIIGPAFGGALLAHSVARQIVGRNILAIAAEKARDAEDKSIFVIRGGLEKLVVDARVLLVDDTIAKGGTLRKVIRTVKDCGGIIVGGGVVCNRISMTTKDFGLPKLESLLSLNLPSWTEAECAVSGPCKRGIPVRTDVGHGLEFLLRKRTKTMAT